MVVQKETYNAIGLMSGTSLDGLDIAFCKLTSSDKFEYQILHTVTIPYDRTLLDELKRVRSLSGLELTLLNNNLGEFFANSVLKSLQLWKINPESVDFIASHGHTVFHQPDRNLTLQIASGAIIAAITGIDTVSDFRTTDVSLGGQGAPLVPVGDDLLFGEYDVCINFGGFANASFSKNGKRIAYDLAPFNLVFNSLSEKLNKNYDENGQIASQGKIIPELKERLDALSYYKNSAPKSLGIEWLEENFYPLLNQYDTTHSISDLMCTCSHHIKDIIGKEMTGIEVNRILISGGGAYNEYLVNNLKTDFPQFKWVVGSKTIVNYKEALIFALLGLLRIKEKINVWSSVTGASSDSCSGNIYKGTKTK